MFDLKNPNKVYALIGTFGYQNTVYFHAKSGEGYALLRTVVEELDCFNASIAARMVKPLINWRRYDPDRQQLMQEQLKIILQNKKISSNVYEIVSKGLKDD
jgi:aminopeptidase N